jgi:transposase-like protein
VCPHCGLAECSLLNPADGRTRRTRTGARSARRVWKCGSCRRQFSALTGTALHGTRVRLPVWVAIATEWADTGAAPTPVELMRRYEVSRDTARRIARLLTAASQNGPPGIGTLLALNGPEALQVRDASAVRRSPRPQAGPTADYR